MTLCLRVEFHDLVKLVRECGGRNHLRENADTRSLQSLLNIQRPANRIQKIAPGANIAQVGDCLRAVRIVQPQDRSLRKDVRSAQARRMLRIAFDFCRTVEMTLNQYRTGVTAQRERRGKEQGPPWDDFFWLANVRDDRL